MKVTLTGASGFIGNHVLNALLSHDVSIIAVTRDKKRMPGLPDQIQVVEFDMADPGVHAFNSLGQPDVLLHLAWDGLPNYRSLHHFENELPKQYAFLRQLVDQGLKSLVIPGTCFEYGMQYGPLVEDTETRPANPYGFAKDTLRKQLFYLKQEREFSLTWARLFYMYGDGQPKTSLFPQLKNAVKQGEPFFNMSGGEQLRDYLHVMQIAHYLVQLAMKQKDLGVVNVCSGMPQSVRCLVEQLIHENNWHIKINAGYYPYPDYEPMAFWGDRSKLDSVL